MKKGIESIKNNMIKKITPIIVITIAVAMGIVYFIARSSLVDNSKSYLDRISVLAASEIDALIYEIEGDSEILANGRVFFEKSTIEEKMNSLKRSNEKLKYLDLAYVDLNGKATYISGATENVKEKEGFKKALKGDTSIEILENNIEKEEYPIECISPILVNGKVDGAIIIKKNAYDLISIIKNMDLGEIGHAYIFNSNGEIISSVELNEVKNNYNIFNKIKENNSEETLKEITTNLKEEKSGILQYEEQGFYDNYLAYSPLEKTEWFIGLVVNEGVVVSGVRNIIFYVGIFLLIALAIILYRISKVVNSMTTSIDSFKDEIYKFSEGNFAAEIVKDKENEKNEIGVMYNSALDTQYSVGEILNNVKFNAEAIDMNAVGLSEIANELSKLTESIVLAIADVTEGTTSQATDLSEISMSMMSFGENIEKVSSEISEIATLSGRINDKSKNSNKELEILTKNIESFKDEFDGFNQSITNTSNEMKNINAMTDLISNISEQTNLLALNAAIEAARAGEAGRGFAVVAEEIRKLAEMSKESTTNICNTVKVILKNTEAVVEKTSVMDEGLSRQTKTIERSIGVFEDISISLGEVIPKIEAMAGSFRKITKEKTEILERVDNVSAISQEISATSEEVTASSEELNSASQEVAAAAESLTALTTDMKAGLEIFKIKDMEEIMNYKEAKYNEELKSEN